MLSIFYPCVTFIRIRFALKMLSKKAFGFSDQLSSEMLLQPAVLGIGRFVQALSQWLVSSQEGR